MRTISYQKDSATIQRNVTGRETAENPDPDGSHAVMLSLGWQLVESSAIPGIETVPKPDMPIYWVSGGFVPTDRVL